MLAELFYIQKIKYFKSIRTLCHALEAEKLAYHNCEAVLESGKEVCLRIHGSLVRMHVFVFVPLCLHANKYHHIHVDQSQGMSCIHVTININVNSHD